MSDAAKLTPAQQREQTLAQEHARLLQQAWAVDKQLEELTESRGILRRRLIAIDGELQGLQLARQAVETAAKAD